MTAIKKTTSKAAKSSPAPATKTAKPAAKKAAATPAAAPAPAPKPATVTPGAVAVAALSAVATPKAVAAKPMTTSVTACIDIGFGNVLYVRGEGPGLSWDKGIPMECLATDQWQISLGESARPYLLKFLVNDLTWSTGPDYTVPSGVSLTLAPQF
jgi:hypothetical protein